MKLNELNEEFLRKLFEEVNAYLNTGLKGNLLKTIKKLTKEYATKIQQDIYQQLNTATAFEKSQINAIGSPLIDNFSRFGLSFESKLNRLITNDRLTFEQKIYQTKNLLLPKTKRYAKTLVMTSSGVITEAYRINQAMTSGTQYFQFAGVTPEREFCIKHFEKVYTLDQINKLNNGQGLSVLFYRGGYNCRHFWRPISQAEYLRLGYKINNVKGI